MAKVKRKISKKVRLSLILAACLLVVVGIVLWIVLAPPQTTMTPLEDDKPSTEDKVESSAPKTVPLPESKFVSSGKHGGFSYDLYEDYAAITSADSTLTDAEVPDKIEDKPVMEIGDNAFSSCTLLESAKLPDTLRRIGEACFYGCGQLEEISLPDSLHEIDSYAFANCKSLQKVDLSDGVEIIGAYAFDETKFLLDAKDEFVIVGNGILIAYKGEGGSLTLPSDVKKIASLSLCETITSLYVPNGVTEIGDWALAGCSNIASISIPASVTRIGEAAFSGCSMLTGVRLGDGVTEVGARAFSFCDNLSEVNYPQSVKSIGDEQFANTTTIQKIHVAPGSAAEKYFLESEYKPFIVAETE